jgi:hypothetical protein
MDEIVRLIYQIQNQKAEQKKHPVTGNIVSAKKPKLAVATDRRTKSIVRQEAKARFGN